MRAEFAVDVINHRLGGELAARGVRFECEGETQNMGGATRIGSLTLKLRRDGDDYTAAMCYLVDMPGCCGAYILSKLEVNSLCRHSGMGGLMLQIVDALCRHNRVGLVMGTSREDMSYISELLAKYDWMCTTKFVNGRSDNALQLWQKEYTYHG